MTKFFLKACLIGLLSILSIASVAQSNAKTNAPRAALAYNAQKSESGKIIFNTSFFIFDYNISNAEKQTKTQEVMNIDPSFAKFELLDVNGTKDMMVIVDVEAADLASLSQKIKFLLERTGVYTVEYNGQTLPLEKFNF